MPDNTLPSDGAIKLALELTGVEFSIEQVKELVHFEWLLDVAHFIDREAPHTIPKPVDPIVLLTREVLAAWYKESSELSQKHARGEFDDNSEVLAVGTVLRTFFEKVKNGEVVL